MEAVFPKKVIFTLADCIQSDIAIAVSCLLNITHAMATADSTILTVCRTCNVAVVIHSARCTETLCPFHTIVVRLCFALACSGTDVAELIQWALDVTGIAQEPWIALTLVRLPFLSFATLTMPVANRAIFLEARTLLVAADTEEAIIADTF